MNTVLLLILLGALALGFERLTRGINSFMGRRLLGIAFLVAFGLIAARCGLL